MFFTHDDEPLTADFFGCRKMNALNLGEFMNSDFNSFD